MFTAELAAMYLTGKPTYREALEEMERQDREAEQQEKRKGKRP